MCVHIIHTLKSRLFTRKQILNVFVMLAITIQQTVLCGGWKSVKIEGYRILC